MRLILMLFFIVNIWYIIIILLNIIYFLLFNFFRINLSYNEKQIIIKTCFNIYFTKTDYYIEWTDKYFSKKYYFQMIFQLN